MALPVGTVTVLFTDVEGSTSLLARLGDRYGDALNEHRRVLRNAVAAAGGREVDTQGDAFFFVFGRAGDAARAAADAQRALAVVSWPDGIALRVRMGLHTGEPTLRREGYIGIDVHRGARICAAAHGGQVLVSQTTHDLLHGAVLDDLGEHRLKDLAEPQRLYQLVIDGLPRTFPPARTLTAASNLPLPSTRFVGRREELEAIRAALAREDVRLLTLTGPGGSGKTRLALEAGGELLAQFNHGVFFVPLAPIVDPALVVPTVSQAIGLAAEATLDAYLAEKHALLVLDNFEQVLDGAPAVAELLAGAPRVKALVTSRAALRLTGERVYPVQPLPERDAVRLFVERVQAVRPGFELTSENEPALAAICQRLDGLPLALELAAARAPLLSPQALLERLSRRLTLLTTGARDAPARQRTLRAAIEWSYDLLAAGEQRLFARLGVFAGGFTLEAAEAVCDADLDELGSLVEKSLLEQDADRFTMLETLREFALEQLRDDTEVRRRHAEFFLALVEKTYPQRLRREHELSGLLEREHDNLRAALDWLAETNVEGNLRLATALGWFWRVHTHLAEGRARLADALRRCPAEGALRARALLAAGELAAWSAERDAALPLLEEAESLFRAAGDSAQTALALEAQSWAEFQVGNERAIPLMEASLALQRETGDPYLATRAEVLVLQMLIMREQPELVEPRCPDALAAAEAIGDLRSIHLVHHFYGDCALMRGGPDAAEVRYRRSLETALPLGDRPEAVYEMQALAMAAGGRSRPLRALRLAGAASEELATLGIDISGVTFWAHLLDRYLGQARRELSPEEAEAAWEKGRQMGWERALEYALDLTAD